MSFKLNFGNPAKIILTLAVLVWSGNSPFDRTTWWMEVAPVFIVLPFLILMRKKIPLSELSYSWLTVWGVILMVGGHWTYAQVPLGFWVQDALDLSRNHYDRFAHFMQGVIPAVVFRELFLRWTPLKKGGWLFFFVCTSVLALSACYEIIEWWAGALGEESAEAFLGTQGDVWDTQWDMFLALCGVLTAQILMRRS